MAGKNPGHFFQARGSKDGRALKLSFVRMDFGDAVDEGWLAGCAAAEQPPAPAIGRPDQSRQRGVDGLVNPRGFVIVDKHQQNPKYPNVFGVGVCVAIAPVGPTPVPCGVPKTGFMIESTVTAAALNIGQLLRGEKPT